MRGSQRRIIRALSTLMLIILLLVSAVWAEVEIASTGQVVGISDGDTIEVLHEGSTLKSGCTASMRQSVSRRLARAPGNSRPS